MRRAARRFHAWDSILDGDRRIPNLTGDRRAQAVASQRNARRELDAALVRAYKCALAPNQPDPRLPDYRLTVLETDADGAGDIAESAFRKLIEQEALVEKISPATLSTALDRYIWNNSDRIPVDALWEVMANNVYMHRLRRKSVLLACVREGVQSGAFGHAESVAEDGALQNLKYREPLALSENDPALGVIIAPALARQAKRESQEEDDPTNGGGDDDAVVIIRPDPVDPIDPQRPRAPRRIAVSKTARGGIDMNAVSDMQNEIIRNLNADGAEIAVTITISATKPEGFSETATRSVRENAGQLGLEIEMEPD